MCRYVYICSLCLYFKSWFFITHYNVKGKMSRTLKNKYTLSRSQKQHKIVIRMRFLPQRWH